ncbi:MULTISPECIES: NUDIX domain-containing protein [Microbacteriaceae]|uniref:NUDIX domain-containing protein n=1 Tax=Microbacterium sp. JB110 TaxID=2024477 RepID=UPI00097EFD03|nr:NUDIX hydrolase [Microbacterium sp. JB110]SJM63487.1 mutT3 [Frigoribacterium sp. JB110]
MTIVPPAAGEPRRPHGPRDPGDAWVVAPTGERYWGRFGAAGLLAFDPARGVLLQHRVGWSHFGGTWALPGGALHQGETAIDGAVREAQEEAGVPDGAVRPRFTHVFDAGVWQYTTVVADVTAPFEPTISDPESLELAWVPVDAVDDRELHPSFAAAWPGLRDALGVRPVLLVDAANVVGSVPDGWWRDRAGAAARLRDGLDALARAGLPADEIDLPHERWFPGIEMVIEGAARAMPDVAGAAVGLDDEASGVAGRHDAETGRAGAADGAGCAGVADETGCAAFADEVGSAAAPETEAGRSHRFIGGANSHPATSAVRVVRAPGSGDDELVARAEAMRASGLTVTDVTSDRALRARLETSGARVRPTSWLRALLP